MDNDPLEQLLSELVAGNVHTLGDLAQRLETSQSMIELMLGDLERAGYVRTVAATSGCSGRCSGCPQGASCGIKESTRLWSVTARGFAAAASGDAASSAATPGDSTAI